MFVTIPCHDEPNLLATLRSLTACQLPAEPVGVIVVVNCSEDAPPDVKARNEATFLEARDWASTHSHKQLRFQIFNFEALPRKRAGVGLARKIAMDEAARQLEMAGNPAGVIACLDADTLVQPNYLCVLRDFFAQNPACQAAGIYYEHPLEGTDFQADVYGAIARYELHLRYYVWALRRAGLAAATQTVGSAMAVRADAYRAQGGMNSRQAGEDFYFLHKFTSLGSGAFGEIVGTTVIPSPRTSHRVPFGTGRAVGEMLAGQDFLTYSPLIFKDLASFLSNADALLSGTTDVRQLPLPTSVASFLEQENFEEKLAEICAHTASPAAARKRFFRWFDPFRAMKFVHHARDLFYPNVPVEEAAATWLAVQKQPPTKLDARSLLLIFRQMDARLSVGG